MEERWRRCQRKLLKHHVALEISATSLSHSLYYSHVFSFEPPRPIFILFSFCNFCFACVLLLLSVLFLVTASHLSTDDSKQQAMLQIRYSPRHLPLTSMVPLLTPRCPSSSFSIPSIVPLAHALPGQQWKSGDTEFPWTFLYMYISSFLFLSWRLSLKHTKYIQFGQ